MLIKQIKDKLRAEYKELVSAGRKMSNIPVNVSAETSSKELVKTAYELEKAIKAFGESVKGPEHMKEMQEGYTIAKYHHYCLRNTNLNQEQQKMQMTHIMHY